MNKYQRCWWEQAQSDHVVLEMLQRKGAAPCHQLHYIQMVTEKISKAYFWSSGSSSKKSHIGFAPFMRLLLQIPGKQRQRVAEIFGFARFKDFRNWTNATLQLVYAIERLAPALANDGPNPEYPWPQEAPEYIPATFEFEVWRELTDTGKGRQLIQVIKSAVEQFPNYC